MEPLHFTSPFSLSITQALAEQLLVALTKLTPVPLSEQNIAAVEKRGGIYQLFLDGRSVYVGKSKNALNSRIGNHYRKLSGRTEGLQSRIKFRALYVNEDLDALAPEKMLIRTLKGSGEALWNQNGFGNKDPGRQRDTSLVKSGHFDRQYPINLNLTIMPSAKSGSVSNLFEAMSAIKASLPYNLRFPSVKDRSHTALKKISIPSDFVLHKEMRVHEWLDWIAERLPAGWMITAFPGYVITYRESSPDRYGSRLQVWLPNGAGHFRHLLHDPLYDTSGDIGNDDEEADEESE